MNTQPQAPSVPSVSGSKDLTLAKRAISYTLQRIKSEPNIGYHMGYGTEVFERLTQAAAALFNEPLEKVQENFTPRDSGRMPAVRALCKINNAYQDYIGGYDQSDDARKTLVTTLGEILRKTE